MARRWYEGKVIAIEQLTKTTKQFSIKIEEEKLFGFLPGQFITFDLPVGTKRIDKWKSYSIASPDARNNIIELCIARKEGGRGTKYLFEEVTIGTKLKFKGPEGSFVLPQEIKRKKVLICTGTGIAPFRSMIKFLYLNNIVHNSIHLIFGARTQKDILYYDEMLKIADEYASFIYTVTLSRDKDWQGFKGYVHNVYRQYYTDNWDCVDFYLCGWSTMIDQAVDILTNEMKVTKDHIKYELYG